MHEALSKCQMYSTHIKTYILWGPIWVQTVCIDHQQTSKFATSRQRVKYEITSILWAYCNLYSPTFKNLGYTGFGLSVILSACHSVSHNFVSALYFENKLIKFYQIFIYALVRSRLGLLHIVLHIFVTELWPLTDARIWFPLGQYLENFIDTI